MSWLPSELHTIGLYAGPPLIGAAIGYVTNHVAIKMLFRPLRPWKIMGIRLPMTPGVIPAKRLELANNMGEVVGDHLLTSDVIARGLANQVFQQHLQGIIGDRLEELMQRELGTLQTIIPSKFKIYFDIASKTVIYQAKERIRHYLGSREFQERAEQAIAQRLEQIFASEAQNIVSGSNREFLYGLLEQLIEKLLHSQAMEEWAEDLVEQQLAAILIQGRSLQDLLPESIVRLLQESIEKQTPALLNRLSTLVSEAEVRNKIVAGACAAVDSFITSMGPMGELARGFLRPEMVEEKVRSYLVEKNDDIVAWLASPLVQAKVASVVGEKTHDVLQRPLADFFTSHYAPAINDLRIGTRQQLINVLRSDKLASLLVSMVKNACESRLQDGNMTLQQAGATLLGEDSLNQRKRQLVAEICRVLQSPQTAEIVDSLVDTLAASLLQKKIGKLGRLVPPGVKDGIVVSLQKMASRMLATEVPGLVQSLNISKIVTEKINTLDILRLEGLLLSIMQEQFKYINIFGGILGFAIGCCNLLLL